MFSIIKEGISNLRKAVTNVGCISSLSNIQLSCNYILRINDQQFTYQVNKCLNSSFRFVEILCTCNLLVFTVSKFIHPPKLSD